MKKHILPILLTVSFILSGCSSTLSSNTVNLMKSIEKNDLAPIVISDQNERQANKKEEITEFSLNLFRESFEDKNILISPLSITSALGMISNGAKGNTLLETESVLNSDIEGLNNYLKAYTEYLPSDKKYKVSIANSIWFKDDESLTVNKDFLQTNKDYYDASVYKAPFDESTKDDINKWVSDKTDGMIDKLLEEKPHKDAMMYLINALSFDAEWENIYEDTQIHDGKFTLENGKKQNVEFMGSSEYSYLETENATGFLKPYNDNKYAFVALLPNENVTMQDFLSSLNGEKLIGLLKNKQDKKVNAIIPKFSVKYETLLNDFLINLGMTDAFNAEKADFSGLGHSKGRNIFIGLVIHKTKIDVDVKGTKAGAITAVEMKNTCATENTEKTKEVLLDRPFFYMIVDIEQNLPLYMGVLMNVN